MGAKTIRSTTCMLDGQEIAINEALKLRNQTRRSSPDFRCVKCGEKVSPHREGNGQMAHFEHRIKNRACSLSIAHPSRS